MPLDLARWSSATAITFALSVVALNFSAAVAQAPAKTTATAASSAASGLTPEIVTLARQLKSAAKDYVAAKCGERPKKRQDETRAARDLLRTRLNDLLAERVSRQPDVQGALDAATEAGEAAAKVAAKAGSSDQEKASARAKFEIARTYLRDTAKAQRDRLEGRMKNETGFTLASLDATCPATRRTAASRRSSRAATHARHAHEPGPSASPGAADAPAAVSIGIGGGSIMFGR